MKARSWRALRSHDARTAAVSAIMRSKGPTLTDSPEQKREEVRHWDKQGGKEEEIKILKKEGRGVKE